MPPAKKRPSLEEIKRYFHLPLSQAAIELGVCQTLLKKCCRKYNISRWPYRKFKSLNRKLSILDQTTTDTCTNLEQQIENNKGMIASMFQQEKEEAAAIVLHNLRMLRKQLRSGRIEKKKKSITLPPLRCMLQEEVVDTEEDEPRQLPPLREVLQSIYLDYDNSFRHFVSSC